MNLEKTILWNLLTNKDYCSKVIPFLKEEYFTSAEKLLFGQINSFVLKYNQSPTLEALGIEIANAKATDEEVKDGLAILTEWDETKAEPVNEKWLLDKTEEFCQEKSIYIAMTKSIEIMNGNNKSLQKGAIPSMLSEALAVTFDPNVGHDYFGNADNRFDFYHRVEEKIPFDLEFFNKITKGGLPKKTLNVILAGTGVGKSLFMCHCAAADISAGYNVLYITLEMAEEKIAERIDANLLNINIADLQKISKAMYDKKMAQLRSKAHGQLIIKEYPTASASTQHFRNLINELHLKKGFLPHKIYVDYLNICASARIKAGANVNSYTYVKAIAEELRGLAVEFNVPLISATQTTRAGFASSDVELTDTSESFGLPATADFMVALTTNEVLESLNQMQVKQLKNRYNDPTLYKRFIIGVDRAKMRLHDVEASAQADVVDSGHDAADAVTAIRELQEKFGPNSKFKKLKV